MIDVESAILTGKIERVFDDDPRGTRFEIVGHACDETTAVAVVVRMIETALVITVYEKKR